MLGVSYNDFWTLTPKKLRAFVKARDLKIKEKNSEFWLQGIYYYQALLCASPIFNSFAKPGTKPIPYLDKPLEFGNEKEIKDEDNTENNAQYIKNEQLKAYMFFNNWANSTTRKA